MAQAWILDTGQRTHHCNMTSLADTYHCPGTEQISVLSLMFLRQSVNETIHMIQVCLCAAWKSSESDNGDPVTTALSAGDERVQ